MNFRRSWTRLLIDWARHISVTTQYWTELELVPAHDALTGNHDPVLDRVESAEQQVEVGGRPLEAGATEHGVDEFVLA